MNEIHKLCECGCGKEVKLSSSRFCQGHSTKGKVFSFDHKLKISKAHIGKSTWNKGKKWSDKIKLKLSSSHLGKTLSKETTDKLSVSHTGKKHTAETKSKMVVNNWMRGKTHTRQFKDQLVKYHTGRKHSLECRLRMSTSQIEYIEKIKLNGGSVYPREGKNEKTIIDIIEKTCSLEILRNNRNLFNKTGKFCDAFIPSYNLVIEILEPHHFKENNELSDYDLDRQVLLCYHLSCMIYYISEYEFLKNSEEEIQRFKDFLLLLDGGIN